MAAPLAPLASSPTRDEPRLSVSSAGSVLSGQVDGAWWPHSRDLAVELGALLPLMVERLGPVERVSYKLEEWDPVARKVDIDGVRMRLAGFHSTTPHTVEVVAEQHRVTLLVIPPDTTPALAASALETAGTDGDATSIADLLSTAPSERPTP
ncbi:DUF5994 family protein [Pseudonocardia pini]|uniref:DUF5994 family protein n=1 Tax=Pseudonocardia pini TaxID=2758030 RepID=UPI0015F03F06|nr:DUF5994 family protein [Pseudonocardia pini]